MSHVTHLTDAALADRLRRIVANPRSWSVSERMALMLEAAERLEARCPATSTA